MLENVESALMGVEYRARTAKPVTGIILLKKAKNNFEFKWLGTKLGPVLRADNSAYEFVAESER